MMNCRPFRAKQHEVFWMNTQETHDDRRWPLWIRAVSALFRLTSKLLIVLIFVALGVFVGGLLKFAHTIVSYDESGKVEIADAIIVPTGGSKRIEKALSLLAAGKGKRLLITGVGRNVPDSSIRKRHSSYRIWFDCCVDMERQALDTIGNAKAAHTWLKSRNFNSAILVTSGYHMPRSSLEFRRASPSVKFHQAAVPLKALEKEDWWTNPETLRLVVAEFLKYGGAYIRKYLDPQSFSAIRSSLNGTPSD